MVVGTDSQAVIKALPNQRSHPGHYLLDAIHLSAERLHAKQDGLIDSKERCQILADGHQWKGKTKGIDDLQLHWVPGHCDFGPNTIANKEAKQAAQGSSSKARFLLRLLRKKLLLSVSTLHQENNEKLKKRRQRHWKNSERENLLRTINNSAPSKKSLCLILGLDRHQASLLFQLCSGHIGINQHLFCICKAESPACPKCQGVTVESVKHFLLDCLHCKNEWHTLQRKLCRNAGSLFFFT